MWSVRGGFVNRKFQGLQRDREFSIIRGYYHKFSGALQQSPLYSNRPHEISSWPMHVPDISASPRSFEALRVISCTECNGIFVLGQVREENRNNGRIYRQVMWWHVRNQFFQPCGCEKKICSRYRITFAIIGERKSKYKRFIEKCPVSYYYS